MIDAVHPAEFQQVRRSARLLHGRETVEAALDRLADEISAYYKDQAVVYLPVMQGGLIPAGMLATRLDILLVQDYIHATRYRGDTRGHRLIWRAKPMVPLAGRRVLIVDDILDEGHTLKAILEYCREEGARDVSSVVLVEKLHDRRVGDLSANFVGLQVPDCYVFGYGLDYKEHFRNVPGIYAVEKEFV